MKAPRTPSRWRCGGPRGLHRLPRESEARVLRVPGLRLLAPAGAKRGRVPAGRAARALRGAGGAGAPGPLGAVARMRPGAAARQERAQTCILPSRLAAESAAAATEPAASRPAAAAAEPAAAVAAEPAIAAAAAAAEPAIAAAAEPGLGLQPRVRVCPGLRYTVRRRPRSAPYCMLVAAGGCAAGGRRSPGERERSRAPPLTGATSAASAARGGGGEGCWDALAVAASPAAAANTARHGWLKVSPAFRHSSSVHLQRAAAPVVTCGCCGKRSTRNMSGAGAAGICPYLGRSQVDPWYLPANIGRSTMQIVLGTPQVGTYLSAHGDLWKTPLGAPRGRAPRGRGSRQPARGVAWGR